MRRKKCLAVKVLGKHGVNEYTGECITCSEKVASSHKERLAAEVAALPLETKQRVLDLLHEGKNIGETREAVGLSLDAVCEIINENIHSASWLGATAV